MNNSLNPLERDRKPKSPMQIVPWAALFVILVLWFVIASLSALARNQQEIPYSTLLHQVASGNVSEVRIAGDQITGTVRKPLPGPAHSVRFATTYPQPVGDRGLIPLLTSHNVVIDASTPSNWGPALLAWLPALVFIGALVWMFRASRAGAGLVGSFGQIKPRRHSHETPSATFNDVGGAEAAKVELHEEVDFLREPKKYRAVGAKIPKGILLVGPPGNGKTLLARAVAGEAHVPFLSLNASEFVEMFVGVGASRVRDLFSQAKASSPCIVFVDELDAVGRRRGAGLGHVNDEREQTLNQLLGEMDGFDERLDVIIMAATNRPDVLDPALLRPGRFDRQVVVEMPDRCGRSQILQIHTQKLRLAEDVDLGMLAAATIGFSGADLASLCNEAAIETARANRSAITMADFDAAHDKLRLGSAHGQLTIPDERRVVAYHECGHALMAWITPHADPVRKVTIVPHGQRLGATEQIPAEERRNLSRRYLMARLAVALAGRTAEEIVFGEITTGAENDLVEATKLARGMVSRWGMGDLGLMAFSDGEDHPFLGYELSQRPEYSEATARRIDQNVQRLIEEVHETVHGRLLAERKRLEAMAEALLREETLTTEILVTILGPQVSTPEVYAETKPAATGSGAAAS